MSRASFWDEVDPSIVRLPVFWEQDDLVEEPLFLWHYRGQLTHQKKGFWQGLGRRLSDPTLRGPWLPSAPKVGDVKILINIDEERHKLVPDERIEALEAAGSLDTDAHPVDVPWAINDQMQERVPQFFLRNLPRAERYVDLQDRLRFNIDEPELPIAEALLEEARGAKLPPLEFTSAWSTPLLDDFRIFLEEVFYLCPWDQMPRGIKPPPEDSLWSSNHSRATLTHDLLQKKESVFIFGHGGGPEIFNRGRKKVLQRTNQAPSPPPEEPSQVPGGFKSYGPPSEDPMG